MIIGITGTYCSGKDTVGDYLQEKAFLHISLSDLIRDEMNKKKIKITRAGLIKYGNDLRRKYGPGILGRMALNSMIANRNYVVTSIRSLFELEVLKSKKNFIHVLIDAPEKVRFNRMLKRTERLEDSKIKTFEDFKKSEASEQSDDFEKQQVHLVTKNPQIIINNDKSIKDLYKKLDLFLAKWKPKLAKRPNWDEYFIELIHAIGSRGTCDRGCSGAVIVKNKYILTTGYVGSPIGTPHCDEEGHQFTKKWHEDGSVTKHCIRTTHAEANAIAQAARRGINIDGSTLYISMTPCFDCAKIIVNSGIKRIVAERDYHASAETKNLFQQAGVKLEIVRKETMPYAKQK